MIAQRVNTIPIIRQKIVAYCLIHCRSQKGNKLVVGKVIIYVTKLIIPLNQKLPILLSNHWQKAVFISLIEYVFPPLIL